MRLAYSGALTALLAARAAALQGEREKPRDPLPLTAAEASEWARTSTSAEVEALIDACSAAAPQRVVRLSLATSAQGRDVLLVLAGSPAPRSIDEARTAGRLVVLVLANIHAGEVEGKEAAQILLREIAEGGHDDLLAELVIAFVPDYNPDGNDALDRRNRADQNGPVEGVGQRPNGQGLDLNRDFMKVEAPETRGLLAAVRDLDAALILDLHATDGSHHGYDLTYAGPMHPAGDPEILRFSRESMLPTLRATMREQGFETFDYGDFARQSEPERGWFTFDCKPRYGTNYFGLANRLTLLSEAYSHEPFERRVAATRAFVLAALRFAAENARPLRALLDEADARAAGLAGATLPARGEIERTRTEPVLVGSCRREPDPVTGLERVIDSGESHPVEMPVHVSFAGVLPREIPIAWAIPPEAAGVAELLARHGIVSTVLEAPRRARLRVFAITQRRVSPRPFQGHALVELEGSDREEDADLPAGTILVPSDQPLARLAFLLLDPASDDGVAAWSLVDTSANATYPIAQLLR